MTKKRGSYRLNAAEVQDTVWFCESDGSPIDFGGGLVSIQVVADNSWGTAAYQLVWRADITCGAVAVQGVKSITPTSAYISQVSVASFWMIGLKNTTVESSALDLFAYLSFGV